VPENSPYNAFTSPLAYARLSLDQESFQPEESLSGPPVASGEVQDESQAEGEPESSVIDPEPMTDASSGEAGSVEEFEPFPLPQQSSSEEPLSLLDEYQGEEGDGEELLMEMPGFSEETMQEINLPDQSSYEEIWSVNPPEAHLEELLNKELNTEPPEQTPEQNGEQFNDISLRDYSEESLAEPGFIPELSSSSFTEIPWPGNDPEPMGDLSFPEAAPEEDLPLGSAMGISTSSEPEFSETGTPPVQEGTSWGNAFSMPSDGFGEGLSPESFQVPLTPDLAEQEQIMRDMAIKDMIERESMYQNFGQF
jgi:hypothetical protein